MCFNIIEWWIQSFFKEALTGPDNHYINQSAKLELPNFHRQGDLNYITCFNAI